MMLPRGQVLETINQHLIAKITQREFDILSEIYKGNCNKQICATLKISENTTKYHIENLYSKMDVSSRTELLAKVIR